MDVSALRAEGREFEPRDGAGADAPKPETESPSNGAKAVSEDPSLDAMHKGKGKGAFKCFGCDGKGHPVAQCPSRPGVTLKCNNCEGIGHYASECTSPGGGAAGGAGLGKGKGKGMGNWSGGDKGGQKGWWGTGKGGNGKGKGKGKKGLYAFDEGSWDGWNYYSAQPDGPAGWLASLSGTGGPSHDDWWGNGSYEFSILVEWCCNQVRGKQCNIECSTRMSRNGNAKL